MPPYTQPKSEIQRLIEAEASRQGLNPALLVAIATQESWLNPNAVGDNGRSLGLFQLQRAAAQDAGIDPNRRGELGENIRGGVTYFKQKLRQSGGNVEQALSRYNRGTPTYRGIGDPHYVENVLSKVQGGVPLAQMAQRQTPAQPVPARRTLASRVTGMLSPRSAQAAEPAAQPGAVDWQRELAGPDTPPLSLRTGPPQMAPSRAPEAPAGSAPPTSTMDWVRELSEAPAAVPGSPVPRSAALAAEQAQAQARPWWQRAAETFGAASPEIALYAPQVPQVEQARAEMSPAEREEFRRLEGQAGTGANLGEVIGQTIGSAVLPGAGTAIGGTLGAVTGRTVETMAQEGRLPTWKELASEAGWSLLPEAAESLGRLGLKTIARGTRGGQIIRFDEAARRARSLPETFEAQTRQEIGQAFDAVRQSGVQLDTGAMRQEIQGLRPGKYADVMAEVRRLDRDMKTGSRYQQLFTNLRQGGGVQVQGWPIGDLQQLRSGLRQRIDQLEHTEARQLLRDVQRAVDEAIDQGMARGRVAAGQTPEQLRQARRDWARLRASEDMGDLIERTITTTPDLSMASMNLRQFADAMRRNTSDLAQGVNRALDQVPGARARFMREMEDIAGLYRTAELPMSDVFGIWRMPGFAMARQWMSQALMTDTGRQLFRQAMIEGRGRLSMNAFAAAVNAGRRELGLEPLVLPESAPAGPASTAPGPAAGGG